MSTNTERECIPIQLCPVTDSFDAVFWDGELRAARLEPVVVWALCKVVGYDGTERTKVFGLIQTEEDLEAPEYIDTPEGSAFLGYCPCRRALASFMAAVDPSGAFK